jgi:hypothetical protein
MDRVHYRLSIMFLRKLGSTVYRKSTSSSCTSGGESGSGSLNRSLTGGSMTTGLSTGSFSAEPRRAETAHETRHHNKNALCHYAPFRGHSTKPAHSLQFRVQTDKVRLESWAAPPTPRILILDCASDARFALYRQRSMKSCTRACHASNRQTIDQFASTPAYPRYAVAL